VEQHQSRDTEEGGGGEVLAADGGGVERGNGRCGSDVEVGGGTGYSQPEAADEDGRDPTTATA